MAPLDDTIGRNTATTYRPINYRFFAGGDERLDVALRFDERTFKLHIPDDAPSPAWTRLDCNRCPNCTLADDSEFCPAARAIAMFLPQFEGRVSYEKAVIEVETPNRTILTKATFQTGMASLIGLVCATSGCPRTQFLRPMARFHLPFADETETLFRSFATWLLMAFVKQRTEGGDEVLSLEGLKRNYQEISVVNASLAERLRRTATRDAALNAVIILDLFAQIAPDNIDSGFADILPALVVEDAA
jgi:hypothetical protein